MRLRAAASPVTLCEDRTGSLQLVQGADDVRKASSHTSGRRTGRAVQQELARRIDSIADATAILDGSSRWTFSEALDCVAVAEAAQRWELVERAALAALKAADADGKPPATLSEAAWQVVRLRLRAIHSIPGLQRSLPSLAGELAEMAGRTTANPRTAIESVKTKVDHLALLLSDATSTSYVKLCSLLRKSARNPHLGILAATRALSLDARNTSALNTRGAARLDLEYLDKAEQDLVRAWGMDKSHYIANTFVRLHMLRSDTTSAVRWSVIAVDAAPPADTVALKVMAAAAVAADDQAQLRVAITRLRELGDREARDPDRWVQLLAARQFMRDGLLALARTTLDELLTDGPYGPAAKLDEELTRELKRRA